MAQKQYKRFPFWETNTFEPPKARRHKRGIHVQLSQFSIKKIERVKLILWAHSYSGRFMADISIISDLTK